MANNLTHLNNSDQESVKSDTVDQLFGDHGAGTLFIVSDQGSVKSDPLDQLFGDHGAGTLFIGSGQDTFAFSEGDEGDMVVDFTNGLDEFGIYGVSDDVGDVNTSRAGTDAVVSFDGTAISIEDTALSEIESSDFIF